MKKRLTLRLDDQIIEKAKRHAAQSGMSVSTMVTNYFAVLGTPIGDDIARTPRVAALFGSLAGLDFDEADWRKHQAERHGITDHTG